MPDKFDVLWDDFMEIFEAMIADHLEVAQEILSVQDCEPLGRDPELNGKVELLKALSTLVEDYLVV